MSNYITIFCLEVITHPCPGTDAGSTLGEDELNTLNKSLYAASNMSTLRCRIIPNVVHYSYSEPSLTHSLTQVNKRIGIIG